MDKGEITIDCHHHSKVIMFKNRKGYLSPSAMENLTGLRLLLDAPRLRRVCKFTACRYAPVAQP